jgi:VanZ family protein
MQKGRRSWFLALGWAIVIFALSAIPGRSMPQVEVLSYDKVLHALVYSVLGALCFAAIRQTRRATRGQAIALAVLAATVYGFTDEFHQLFVEGRNADLHDVIADAAGGLLGASLAAMLSLVAQDAPS